MRLTHIDLCSLAGFTVIVDAPFRSCVAVRLTRCSALIGRSLGRLLELSSDDTLWLFGEIYREYTPEGVQYDEKLHGAESYPGYQETLHGHLRTFMACGWDAVSFPEGLVLEKRPALWESKDTAFRSQPAQQ